MPVRLSLALSLVFGAGQVVVGIALVVHGVRQGRWRGGGTLYLATLCGLWLVASGLAELLVSGMVSAHTLIGMPGAPTVRLWRARADTWLLLVTIALCAAAAAGLLAWRARNLVRR